jgi:hypothetical protein
MPWWNARYYKMSPSHSPPLAYLGESLAASRTLS